VLKGPVLGPMVICGVCFSENNLKDLTDIGVRDSKKLSSKKREFLAEKIKEKCLSYKTVILSAKTIDERQKKGQNMITLEQREIARIIDVLRPDIVYVDAADVNEKRFGLGIKKFTKFTDYKIISKHGADQSFPVVSAASIIAKTTRDEIIEKLSKKYGSIGSGYPSDKKTIEFIRNYLLKYKRPPPIARKSWDTTKKLVNELIKNKKITDFLK